MFSDLGVNRKKMQVYVWCVPMRPEQELILMNLDPKGCD